MAESGKSEENSGQGKVNAGRVAVYARLMDAQQLIAEALAARGVDDDQLVRALELAADDSAEHDCDIYLNELSRYVAALGGRLELRAVFPQETVTVPLTDTHDGGGD